MRRAIQRGLSILGEPSLLDGAPCGNVHIARGVEMFAGILDQANDNHVARADLATISVAFGPKTGAVLEHPTEGRFRLMKLAADNGAFRRYVVAQVRP